MHATVFKKHNIFLERCSSTPNADLRRYCPQRFCIHSAGVYAATDVLRTFLSGDESMIVTSQPYGGSFEGTVSKRRLCAFLHGLSIHILYIIHMAHRYALLTWESHFLQHGTFKGALGNSACWQV